MSEILSEERLKELMNIVVNSFATPEARYSAKETILASHRALQRRVEWTTERPYLPGYYWIRASKNDSPYIAFLYLGTKGMRVDSEHGNVAIEDHAGYEYQGPLLPNLPPPHEARG